MDKPLITIHWELPKMKNVQVSNSKKLITCQKVIHTSMGKYWVLNTKTMLLCVHYQSAMLSGTIARGKSNNPK